MQTEHLPFIAQPASAYQDTTVRLPRSNIRRIVLYSLCAGLALGLLGYGLVRVIERTWQPGPALATLMALLLGLALGGAIFAFVKMVLRQAAYDLHTYAVDLVNTPLPPLAGSYREDEVTVMRTTLRNALTYAPPTELHTRLAHDLAAASDLHTALERAAIHMSGSMPLHGAGIFLYDAERNLLYVETTWGLDTLDPTTTLDVDATAIGRALHEQRPLRYTNAQSRSVLPMMAGLEPITLLCLPLIAAGQPIGVLCLTNHESDAAFNQAQQTFARGVADLLALAVQIALHRTWLGLERERLAAFERLAASLDTTARLETALEQVLRTVAHMTDSDHGTLLLLEADESRVRYRIALRSGNLAPLELVGPPILKHGLAGWALRERRADILEDTELDPRWLPMPSLGEMRSALVAPLLYGDQALGVLTLAHPHPRHYSRRSLALACALAAYAVNILAQMQINLTVEDTQVTHLRRLFATRLADDQIEPMVRDRTLLDQAVRAQISDAVVIAAGLRGFARLSEQLAPEVTLNQVLTPYIETFSTVVHAHQGYLDRRDDDVVLAIFGHPLPSAAAHQRAVDAALALNAAARQLRARWRKALHHDLAPSIGVASGPIVTGVFGADQRPDFALLGPAIKRAQRLQTLARSGEILLTDDVVAGLPNRETLQIEALQPLAEAEADGIQRISRLLP